MARINFARVHTATTLPNGYYDFLIANCEKGYNRNETLRYTIELRVHEPESLRGQPFYQRCNFGTRPFGPGQRADDPNWRAFAELDDPECQDEINHYNNPDIRQFKRVCEAAGIDCNKDWEPDELMDQLNAGGLYVGGRITQSIQEGEGRFAGMPQNTMTMVYTQGREKPRLLDEEPSSKTPAAASLRTRPAAMTPQMAQAAAAIANDQVRTRSAAAAISGMDERE